MKYKSSNKEEKLKDCLKACDAKLSDLKVSHQGPGVRGRDSGVQGFRGSGVQGSRNGRIGFGRTIQITVERTCCGCGTCILVLALGCGSLSTRLHKHLPTPCTYTLYLGPRPCTMHSRLSTHLGSLDPKIQVLNAPPRP